MTLNSLSLNKTKTKTLIFGTAAGANQAKQFVPNSQVVTSAKYLGLEIDHKLSFKEHANQLLKKTAKNVPLPYQLKKFLPSSALFRAYKSFIQSIYQYDILVYGTADKKVTEKIENQPKMLIRIIFRKRKFESTLKLRSKYKIPLVRELHVYEFLKLLAAVLRKAHAHPEINSYISPKEIHTLFDPEKRNKLLKTEIRLTKQNKNSGSFAMF